MGEHIYDVIIVGGGIAGVMTAISLQNSQLQVALVEKNNFLFSGSTFENINGRWGITYAKDKQEEDYLLNLINKVGQNKNINVLSRKLVTHSFKAFSDLRDLGIAFEMDNNEIRRVAPCYADIPLASIICSVSQARETFEETINYNYVSIFSHSPVEKIISEDGHYSVCIKNPEISKIKAKHGVVIACGGDIGLWQPNLVSDGLTGDGFRFADDLNLQLFNENCRQRIWDDVDGRKKAAFNPQMFFDKRYEFYDYKGKQIQLPEHLFSFRKARISHAPIANSQPDRVVDEFFMQRIPHNKPDYAIVVKEKASGEIIDRILPFYQVSTGGILIDETGQTSRKGIYAVGEAAAGMHGLDRVGGMMICSSVVFAKLIAENISIVANKKSN